jgi:hypothetical protein
LVLTRAAAHRYAVLAAGELSADTAAALRARLVQIDADAARIDVPRDSSDQLYNLRPPIRLLPRKLDRVGTDAPTP